MVIPVHSHGMKIIFLKDVPRVGRAYQVKEVSDGYALNFLFPRRLAEKATPEKLKAFEANRALAEAESNAATAEWDAQRATLNGKTIVIKAKTNEQGHLYQGVDAERVAQEIQMAHKILLSAETVKMPAHFKEVGECDVVVSKGGKDAQITVSIIAA